MQHEVEQEVGSYALMAGTGFEHKDMMLCCRFAEGDTRILKMKLARDRLAQLARRGGAAELARALTPGDGRAEAWAALRLGRRLAAARREGAAAVARAWDAEWEAVYRLADLVCDRHARSVARRTAAAVRHGDGGGFPEPVVSRL